MRWRGVRVAVRLCSLLAYWYSLYLAPDGIISVDASMFLCEHKMMLEDLLQRSSSVKWQITV